MPPTPSRIALASLAFLALAACLRPATAGASPAPKEPDLVILSTTDVKGKTGPCGCHIPKGGFSRQASFVDSMRTAYDRILFVDNGGYFPEEDGRQDLVRFMMSTMKTLGVEVAGIGPRDLRYGRAFLESTAQATGLPLVCSNLVDAKTRQPIAAASRIEKVSGVRVGVFALIDPAAHLGPDAATLAVTDPGETARKTTAALRKQGAEVVLLLSQLGKMRTEDLAAKVPGIDAVVVGNEAPVLQKGRVIEKTTACYGGEQGQYLCRTVLALDARRRVTSGSSDAVMMSPEVGDKAAVLEMVKAFDEAAKLKSVAAPASGESGAH